MYGLNQLCQYKKQAFWEYEDPVKSEVLIGWIWNRIIVEVINKFRQAGSFKPGGFGNLPFNKFVEPFQNLSGNFCNQFRFRWAVSGSRQ